MISQGCFDVFVLRSSDLPIDFVRNPLTIIEKFTHNEMRHRQVVTRTIRNPIRVLVIQVSKDRNDAKVSRIHATSEFTCENLVNSLKLLANQQQDGDSPVNMIVQGFSEKCRLSTMDELRRFITVENNEAVKVGDLEKHGVVAEVHGRFFSQAVVREGADELTLRREEEGVLRTFIDTTDTTTRDWRAIEGSDWETITSTRSCTKRSNVRNLEKNKEAFCTLTEAKDKGILFRFGQRAADSNTIPSTVGSLGNPLVEPDGCSGRRTETFRGKMWSGPVIGSERRAMCFGIVPQAFGTLLPFGLCIRCKLRMLEVMFSNDEDGEQSVGNLFLVVVEQSSSGTLVASFEDEERARIALSCHLSVDLRCQGDAGRSAV